MSEETEQEYELTADDFRLAATLTDPRNVVNEEDNLRHFLMDELSRPENAAWLSSEMAKPAHYLCEAGYITRQHIVELVSAQIEVIIDRYNRTVQSDQAG